MVSWGGVLFENSIVCFFGFEQTFYMFVGKCDTNYFIYFLIDDRLWFQLCQRGSCTLESSYSCASAAASALNWQPLELTDVPARRAFWTWYLNEAIPTTLAT